MKLTLVSLKGRVPFFKAVQDFVSNQSCTAIQNKQLIILFEKKIKFNFSIFSKKFTFSVISSQAPLQEYEEITAMFLNHEISILFCEFKFGKKSGFFEHQFDENVTVIIHNRHQFAFIAEYGFHDCYLFFTKKEIEETQNDSNIPNNLKSIFSFKQLTVFDFQFSPDTFFILDKKTLSRSLDLSFPDARSTPKGYDYTNLILKICPGHLNNEDCCPHCGAALFNSKFKEKCCKQNPAIQKHLPPIEGHPDLFEIICHYKMEDPNFIRYLNRFVRPVLQKTDIANRKQFYSTLFIKGITYAMDSRFQFLEPVYLIASNYDLNRFLKRRFGSFTNEEFLDIQKTIQIMININPTIAMYVHSKLDALNHEEYIAFIEGSSDKSINAAIINDDQYLQNKTSLIAFHHEEEDQDFISDDDEAVETPYFQKYKTQKIDPMSALYDQLLYPLIFYDGKGGIGKLTEDEQWTPRDMRCALRAICLQPPSSYIKHCSVLLDEYLCAGYGRDMQIKINELFNIQKTLMREDEIRNQSSDSNTTNFGIKTFIPSNLTGSPAYWSEVSKHGFYLSMILGAPTFFITFTENPKWHEVEALNTEKDVMLNSVLLARVFYQKKFTLLDYIKTSKIFGEVKGYLWRDEYQKRGLPHCHLLLWTDFDTSDVKKLDETVTCRLPLDDPRYENQEKVRQLRELSQLYMTHTCTSRCGGIKGQCCYNYPKPILDETKIINNRIEFARNEGDENIVPHSPKLIALFRSHIDVEPVLSASSIGYVLKYATKNSDDGTVDMQEIRYCGQTIEKDDQLRRYAATHVVSAPEAYNAISGLKRQEISPSIEILSIHEEGKRIIMVKKNSSIQDAEEELNHTMSRLERYFKRPFGEEFDSLTYTEYYGTYSVQAKNSDGIQDNGYPRYIVSKKRKRTFCAIKLIKPDKQELFALRLLLQEFPARSFDELRRGFSSFYEAAVDVGLIGNDAEYEQCMNEAIQMHRPPSDLRFLMMMFYEAGADLQRLIHLYQDELQKDLIDQDGNLLNPSRSLQDVFATMFAARNIEIPDFLGIPEEDDIDVINYDDSDKNLNEGQQMFINAVIEIVEKHQEDCSQPHLMFLQGRAGTGKTFTIKKLINIFRSQNRKVLVAGSTGIAASQYQGGQTIHSLFALSIDQKSRGNEMRSNIGLHTRRGDDLMSAHLIIIDEVSMVTQQTINSVDFTLRYLASEEYGFKNATIEYDKIPPFGNIPILFVGDFLQLPPVVPNSSASVIQRLITKNDWWNDVVKFGLFQPMRSINKEWTDHLINVGNGSNGKYKFWHELRDKFGITVTDDFQDAVSFYLSGTNLSEPFKLDVQWICATNNFVNTTNDFFYGKRNEVVPTAGKIYATTIIKSEFDRNTVSNNLSISQKFEFIKNMKFKDIPDSCLQFQEGEPVCLLRNLSTKHGLVKNKRCLVKKVLKNSVIVLLEDGSDFIIPRINFEGSTNGIQFSRRQVPLKPLFAGTVHKSQGMTLSRGVIDLRSQLWEHGQLYVALSRFKNPEDICILLPKNDPEDHKNYDELLIPVAEKAIVQLVTSIENSCKQNEENQNLDVNEEENQPKYFSGFIVESDYPNDDINPEKNDVQDEVPHLIQSANISETQAKTVDDYFPTYISMEDIDKYSNPPPEEKLLNEKMKNEGFVRSVFTKFGLRNMGNTCYLNSILQILHCISPFVDEITKDNPELMSNRIYRLYQSFFKKISSYCDISTNNIIEPTEIMKALNIPPYSSDQEDVHEMFLKIMNQIADIDDLLIFPFFFTTAKDVTFQASGSVTVTDASFYTFVISVPNIGYKIQLTELLDFELSRRLIDGFEHQIQFTQISDVFSISLNRVAYERKVPVKIMTSVICQEEIFLPCGGDSSPYELFAMIVHIGSSAVSGHYVSYIRMEDKWFYFNDEVIFEITYEKVFNDCFDSQNKTVSMAFYIKKENQPLITDDNMSYFYSCLTETINSVQENQKQKEVLKIMKRFSPN